MIDEMKTTRTRQIQQTIEDSKKRSKEIEVASNITHSQLLKNELAR